MCSCAYAPVSRSDGRHLDLRFVEKHQTLTCLFCYVRQWSLWPEADKKQILLTKALSDSREHIRINAASALGDIGSAAKSALPALRKASQDEAPNAATAAKDAIEEIQGS